MPGPRKRQPSAHCTAPHALSVYIKIHLPTRAGPHFCLSMFFAHTRSSRLSSYPFVERGRLCAAPATALRWILFSLGTPPTPRHRADGSLAAPAPPRCEPIYLSRSGDAADPRPVMASSVVSAREDHARPRKHGKHRSSKGFYFYIYSYIYIYTYSNTQLFELRYLLCRSAGTG